VNWTDADDDACGRLCIVGSGVVDPESCASGAGVCAADLDGELLSLLKSDAVTGVEEIDVSDGVAVVDAVAAAVTLAVLLPVGAAVPVPLLLDVAVEVAVPVELRGAVAAAVVVTEDARVGVVVIAELAIDDSDEAIVLCADDVNDVVATEVAVDVRVLDDVDVAVADGAGKMPAQIGSVRAYCIPS